MSVREPSKPNLPDDRKRSIDAAMAAVLEKRIDAAAIAAMFRAWADEDAREPEPIDSWAEFTRALDADRQSTRKLFP